MNENNVNNTEVPVQQPVATPVQQPAATPVQQEINKPMQTIDSNEKNINPNSVMERNINVGANAPTNIDDIQIDTVTIDASTTITAEEYVEKEKYKISGTADESDLKLETNEPKDEVLDEVQIKRDLQKENQKFKDTFKILYRCNKCGFEHKNIVANDDNMDLIINLSVQK